MRPAPVHVVRSRSAVTLLVAAVMLVASASDALAESVGDQLARLKSEVRSAGRAYDRAYWKLDEAEVKLEKIDRQIAVTERELAAARARLRSRVGMMYRSSSGLGMLDVVLAADTYEDMVTRIDFLYRIGRADAAAVAEVEALQARLASQRAQLSAQRKKRQAAVSALRKERNALARKMAAKQAQYSRLAGIAGFSTPVPKGAMGWVFPVRGVCYYGNTWGASRSGGRRRHKGTDIMAARGTPCVAVLSGSVSSRDGGLGGKTIWLTADNGDSFYYAHLDRWVVRSGRVRKGQLIATVGSTGNAAGGAPHLHFEYHPHGGSAVNPYPYLRSCE